MAHPLKQARVVGVHTTRQARSLSHDDLVGDAPGGTQSLALAACLEAASAGALDHAVAGHVSAESAHGALLERLGKAPLLSLGMRLGEGSGAALAIPVLKGAVACLSGMATFAEAGVSDG